MKGLIWDILLFSGIGSFAIGLAFIYWPLSLIFIGVAFIIIGILGARSASGVKPSAANEVVKPETKTQ